MLLGTMSQTSRPQDATIEGVRIKLSLFSDNELLAYYTAAAVEVLRRYATVKNIATNEAGVQQSTAANNNLANLRLLPFHELLACFYEVTIAVLGKSVWMLMAAHKELKSLYPGNVMEGNATNVLTNNYGPRLLAAAINMNIKILHLVKSKNEIAPQSSMSDLPLIKLLPYTDSVVAEIIYRRSLDTSDLTNISTLSGPELVAYIAAATIAVSHKFSNEALLTLPAMEYGIRDKLLISSKTTLLACFNGSTKDFLLNSLKPIMESRERTNLTNPQTHTNSEPHTNPQPQPQPENQHLDNVHSALYNELICRLCRTWIPQGNVKACACKVVCESCASPLIKCEDCQYTLEQTTRLINFHQRVVSRISRPCKYKQDGCRRSIVQPDDPHESNCEYEPVPCVKCNSCVSKVRIKDHFQESHFLRNNNPDVKLTDFYLEDTGLRKVKCVINQGLILYILISNLENLEEFIKFTILYPVTDLNMSVKLDFHINGYSYSRTSYNTLKKQVINKNLVSIIKIDKSKFNDWVSGQCKLNIDVVAWTKKKKHLKRLRNQYLGKKRLQ